MVPKESPTTRIMGYSSFDCIKNPWIDDNLKFISNEHEVNTSLISEDPDSLSNLNRLEEDDDASSGSDDSYNSCNLTIPSKKDKQVFFNILKHFLEDRTILQEGNEEERWCDKSKLKLKYMGRKCNALILDGDGNELWKGIIKTKNIYLNWRGDEEEPLSLENLQIVQNTLKFLGIQNNKVCNCFSLARTKLMEEQKWVQENMKLKIICCEVILTFGKGKNLATVLYDDIEKIPKSRNVVSFRLLKKMLQTLSSLQNGEEAQDQCDGKILSLTYWTENCQVAVLNACGLTQFSKRLPVQEIYLQYGEGLMEKTLSAENLQRVQNDLKLLGIQSEEIRACFSLAKTKFTEELQCLQKSMILKIICDDIILSFLSGEEKNLATVLYDSNLDKPVYNINVANWWMRLERWFSVVMCELRTTTRALYLAFSLPLNL
ncbi:hypothetical protein L345_16966, partial [Ophiophagus hannah]